MSNNELPLVSVVVPCYNLAHYLEECIESILSQTYSELEVLIMDDASPDNTQDVALSYQKKDSRVKYIRNEKNLGHIKNYNKGIELSRGKYVYLISADDKMLPENIEKKLQIIQKDENIGFVFSPVYIDFHGKLFHGLGYIEKARDIYEGNEIFPIILSRECLVPSLSVLCNKQYLARVGAYNELYPHSGDFELWLRLSKEYKVGYVNKPLAIYRVHPLNMHKENANRMKIEKDVLSILEHYTKDISKSFKQKVYFNRYCLLSKNYAGVHNFYAMFRCILKAFFSYPLWILDLNAIRFIKNMIIGTLKNKYFRTRL